MSSSNEFGGSIPVENVQKLSSSNIKHIPDRYIRPELELDEISIDESFKIPVIDMMKLATGHLGYQDEMEKLHQACKEWGFFQLINHDMIETIKKMKVVTEEFFKLPIEEKLACAQEPNTIEGYGQAFVVSDDQKLDWGDMLFLAPFPLSRRNMKFWPTNPTAFRSTLNEYSTELQKTCVTLVKSMAKNLGVDSDEVSSIFENGGQGIRMNYYPPCLHADKVIGLTPHSDGTGLTLLVQLNDVQGLQIKKNNKWVPIDPIPDAIVVNIGDLMEIMSNGEYKSIEHRALVNFQKERLSVAGFHGPNFGMKIGPLPPLVNNGAKYKTIEFEEYVKMLVSSKLDGKNLLSHLKL